MDKTTNSFYYSLDSLQSEMLSSIIDYTRGGNYHPLVKYKQAEDMLYFKNHEDEWVNEYEVDVWLIAEVADSVNARKALVDMAYDKRYLEYIEYDECNDSLILKLDRGEIGEDGRGGVLSMRTLGGIEHPGSESAVCQDVVAVAAQGIEGMVTVAQRDDARFQGFPGPNPQ